MQVQQYSIPTERLGDFEKKFQTIANKAAKIGGLVGYKIGERKQERITSTHRDDEGNEYQREYLYDVTLVTVWGEAPRIEGWEVIAVIDHTPAQAGSPFNIVHLLGSGETRERFRTMDNGCDHCGFDRKRKKTVVIRNLDTREQKHVGLGCLADFTGSNDPHRAARLCQYVNSTLYDWGGFGSDAEPLVEKELYLELVASDIRRHGWQSRSESRDQSTADSALERYNRLGDSESRIGTEFEAPYDQERVYDIVATITDADRERVTKALDWLEFEADKSNDFIDKLHAALAGKGLVRKHVGIAAALFIAHDKAVARNRDEQARAVSGHVGVVGERDEFVITVTGKREYTKRTYSHYDSPVGVLVMMADDAGNILKWFTSPGKTEARMEESHRYRVAATVKKHGEFKDINETTLSRVSIREELS
jgi:hypothetical protein